MILFLSTSFLRRVRLHWKPSLTAFLIGERNLYFFYPDSLIEVPSIDQNSIDAFLKTGSQERWTLLGFLSQSQCDFFPGYIEVITDGDQKPEHWLANLHRLRGGSERKKLEVRTSGVV